MATLTAQEISEAGTTVTYASATADGDVVDNDGKVFLHVKNGGGSEITVTITAQTTSVDSPIYGTLTKANASKAIAGSAEAFIGPFEMQAYNNSDEQIAITYTGVTSVTIAALYLG
tara:strand:- start:1875 stop:2222 length:348 start_codon:yes stop_codon:yes gene_type:complete